MMYSSRKIKALHTVMLVVLLGVLIASCTRTERPRREPRMAHADSVLFNIGVQKDYEHMRALSDSFEFSKDISSLDANRWRGVSYYHQGQYRLAEMYYRKALESNIESDQDLVSYIKVARRLSELLLVKGDFEGALRIAIPAIAKMNEKNVGTDIDFAILLNNIGCCQLNLGRDEEANKSFITAREHYAKRWQSDSTSRGLQEAVVGTVYTSMAYINMRRYEESIYWIDRTEMLLDKYRQRPDALVGYFDEYQGRIEIMRAVALQGLDRESEARKAYLAFMKTDYSKTGPGRINANDYLVAAKRYAEAANNYQVLDKTLHDWGMQPSLDNIQLYMLPKFFANDKAGRQDSARVIAERIFELLDTAIINQKNSATAELATIYDTQGKEAEIARQQADLNKQRLFSTGVALVLVIVFFIIYTLHRRAATQRIQAAHNKLNEAHQQLQAAYDQLEETTAAKERIESELRIARNIQQSIVPNKFPEYNGLDLYAYMMPAKEVGGDLYDYLLDDKHIYICLGDVSGKGVPASLFMAQAARLFRAMAKQQMMPADIATRLNDELCEGNENGMFVTMFLALINLETGTMDFCNAGHNPPVLGDEFMNIETNAPIGLWPGLQFVGEHIDNIEGKSLFLYSDGLNEAENKEQEQFGDDHLLNILHTMHFDNARQLIEYMKDAVEKHRNGAQPNDDLTMMELKFDKKKS